MLLLDTNALLWLSGGSVSLGRKARAAIEAAVVNSEAAFSAVSVWETALLVQKGRHALGQSVDLWRGDLLDAGLREAALDGAIASLAVGLPDLHADPADRFIAATSIRMGAQLVTSDRHLIGWSAKHAPVRAMDARQ
jgi:PIN domain nuclease of toxin-antitoxin system